jgi:hypothetical protein
MEGDRLPKNSWFSAWWQINAILRTKCGKVGEGRNMNFVPRRANHRTAQMRRAPGQSSNSLSDHETLRFTFWNKSELECGSNMLRDGKVEVRVLYSLLHLLIVNRGHVDRSSHRLQHKHHSLS